MGLMAHQKSFRVVLVILLLICAAVFAMPSMAEQASDTAGYYVFIRMGNEADYAGSLPSILNAFGFLHPDYANVMVHIYKVPSFNQRTDNCIELYSGTAGTRESLAQIQSALANLVSTEQSVAGVAAPAIMETVKAEGGKVLFVGSFNTDSINEMKSKWIPLVREIPYAVLNSNQHQIGAAANSILIRNDDIPATVMDLYRMMCANQYDQTVELQATTENAYEAAKPENTRQIRILAPANSYYAPEEAFYTDQQMVLITVEPQSEQYKIELEDNGAEKKIYVSTVYDPYHLNGIALEEQKDSYTMSDRITVKAAVESRPGQTLFTFVPEEWSFSTVLRQEGKEETVLPMTWNGTAFEADISLRDKSGEYDLAVKASNVIRPWADLTGEAGRINVSNGAPLMKADAEENKRIIIWLDDPLHNEYETVVPVRDWFTDDGPAEDLTFTLAEDVPWAEIRDGELHILTDKMGEEASGILQVSATDATQLTSSRSLKVDVSGYSVSKHMPETRASIRISGEEDGAFHKDTPVQIETELIFPDIMKPYMDLLSEKGTLDEFLGMIKAAFTVNEETLDVNGEKTEQNDMPGLRYQTTYEKVRDTGLYTVAFKAVIPEMNELTVSETDTGLSIVDRIPTLNTEGYTETIQKEIPGPLILNKDLPASEGELSIDLGKLINTEVNDVITVKLAGKEGMELFRTDSGYYYTDKPEDGWEKTDGIVWDSREEAPKLTMRSSAHGEWSTEIRVTDDGDNEAKGSPLKVTVKNRFRNEDLLITIALAVIGVIVLLIILAILHQILKPAYYENDVLQVSMNNYSAEIPLQSWKKKGFTLRELLVYSGVPAIGALPAKAMEKVELRAGGKKRRMVIRNAKKTDLQVKVDGVLQGGNRIYLESSNNKAEIVLNEQETITLRMLDE